MGDSYVSFREIEWRRLGACRGLDASIFYPDDDDDATIAKSVCEGCAVRAACLEHALASREKAGVWGGATERERRRIIRQRRRSA
jgi:WhiB family redox-sensing transcriptional regulator